MKLTNKQLENLRVKKGKNNLNIIELSKNIGVSRYTMSSIVNGRTDGLSKNTVEKIETYLQEN